MIDRRHLLSLVAGGSVLIGSHVRQSWAENVDEEDLLVPMDSPDVSELTKAQPFGSHPASQQERERADKIIANTPTGPRPFDIAKSFYDRFYTTDPHAISEWPRNESWNPLIARFFEATNYHTSNDTVAWCAAFMNWCLERSHRPATKSSSSQSFATTDLFDATTSPKEGDIAVFTCYEKGTNSSVGLGHVTFFKRMIDDQHFLALGGNQSGKRPSIIGEKAFPVSFSSTRKVGSERVPVDYRLNRFLHVV